MMEKIGNLIETLNVNLPEIKEFENTESPLQRLVDMHNAEKRKSSIYNCDICGNKRYIEKVRKNEYGYEEIITVECECLPEVKALIQAQKNGFAKQSGWDSYQTNYPWQQFVKKKAQSFVENSKNEWFFISGQSGSGKTLICSIIANELLIGKGKNVLFISWMDFIAKIKRLAMNREIDELNAEIARAKKAEILFIDDLLKNSAAADMNYLFEIINWRYSADLQTIISTERTPTEFGQSDEAIYGRIAEKSKKYIVAITPGEGKNQRLNAGRAV